MNADWLKTLRAEVEAGPGAGGMLLVAVSGGGDSVALLHGLAGLREALGLRLVVAHLDHALRPESGADAAWVGEQARALGLMCLRERREVVKEGGNLEAAARWARYALLDEAARAVGADAVALAHTLDDQAETVLLHLLRGAGLEGLRGMARLAPSPHPGTVVPLFRPLLGVAGATLRAWLSGQGLGWREDATNADTRRARGWLRYEVLPLLESRHPGTRERLGQSATLLAADYDVLLAETNEVWQKLAQPAVDGVAFDRDAFGAQPAATQRRLLRRAVEGLASAGLELGFKPLSHAVDLAARGRNGSRATLPGGLVLRVKRERLWVGREEPTPAPPTLEVSGPGTFTEAGWRVTVEAVGREALPPSWAEWPSNVALLDAAAFPWPLRLRAPEPGERWEPLGMNGQSVTLRDWLARHHVPAPTRGGVPLLTDADGRILWVVGWQVGHIARVQAESARLLRVEVLQEL